MTEDSNFMSAKAFWLFIALGAVLWRAYNRSQRYGAVESLPVPPSPSWIFGHEREVAVSAPGAAFKSWANMLGLTYRIKAAFRARDVLVLCDPEGISHILQHVYDYHHSRVVRPRVERLLGRGIGWVEGQSEHRRMRQLISPSLSHDNMREMASDVWSSAVEVVDDLTHQVQTSQGGLQVNLFEVIGKATLTIVGRVAFQHDFEGGKSEQALQILEARRSGISPAMSHAGFLTLMLLRRFPFLNELPIGAIQAQGLARQVIQSGVAKEMIKRNEDALHGLDLKAYKDLLSRLLIAHSAGTISTDELYAQISTFIITGNDTSTQTLAYLIWELARHPNIQERLRNELKCFPGEPSYDDFQTKLPYLDAVVKETLRKYPGLPYMERVAMKSDVIPLRQPVKLSDGTFVSKLPVSPGQVVLIPILSIHRMDSVWRNGDSFLPERWLEKNIPQGEHVYSGWSNMLTFSDGPRNCIGLRLGVFQMKVVLFYLMERFRFVDTGEDVTFRISSSLQAWVTKEKELGPCLPVGVELL